MRDRSFVKRILLRIPIIGRVIRHIDEVSVMSDSFLALHEQVQHHQRFFESMIGSDLMFELVDHCDTEKNEEDRPN